MTVQMTAAPTLAPVVTIKLAATSDELLQSFALRAAVFMGEQQCPYDEVFLNNETCHAVLFLTVIAVLRPFVRA